MISLDDTCKAVIAARWIGELQDSPIALSNALSTTAASMQPPISVESWATEVLVAGPTASSTTNEQTIITYDEAAPHAELTRHTERLTYAYDGQNAQISALGAYCHASTLPLEYNWTADKCTVTERNDGPASIITASTSGSYHCASPCELANPVALNSTIEGNSSGLSTCTLSLSGQIVKASKQYIVQGCS
jgi:hypothetical protein